MSPSFFPSTVRDFRQLTGISELMTDDSLWREKKGGVVLSRTISWSDTECVQEETERKVWSDDTDNQPLRALSAAREDSLSCANFASVRRKLTGLIFSEKTDVREEKEQRQRCINIQAPSQGLSSLSADSCTHCLVLQCCVVLTYRLDHNNTKHNQHKSVLT